MDRLARLLRAAAAGGLLASIMAGCGTMPGSGPTALDPMRMVNAIATDDVGYVRGAVENKVVSVNQLVPAPAYMEGTPLITIAARAGALEVLQYLIKAGADVNAATPAGERRSCWRPSSESATKARSRTRVTSRPCVSWCRRERQWRTSRTTIRPWRMPPTRDATRRCATCWIGART